MYQKLLLMNLYTSVRSSVFTLHSTNDIGTLMSPKLNFFFKLSKYPLFDWSSYVALLTFLNSSISFSNSISTIVAFLANYRSCLLHATRIGTRSDQIVMLFKISQRISAASVNRSLSLESITTMIAFASSKLLTNFSLKW